MQGWLKARNERVKGYTSCSWLAKAESFAAAQAAKELKALQAAAGAAGGLECRHGPEDRNGCGDWVAKAEAAAVLQEQGRSKGGG